MQQDFSHSEAGFYARKQIFSRSRVISFSHKGRFRLAVEILQPLARGKAILDYGCGDATLLRSLCSGPDSPSRAVGAEIDPRIIQDCRVRHGSVPHLEFADINQQSEVEVDGLFDVVVCTEVLEHVVEVEKILGCLDRLLRDGGILVISVPVETGPVLAFKQVIRTVAGWRGIGDYPGFAPYTWGDFIKGIFAGKKQHMVRPIDRNPEGFASHSHKGFNWRALKTVIGTRFDVEKTLSSPWPWLPAGLGSQVWFIARKKAGRAGKASA